MHVLIVGPPGSGKSTLIRQVLKKLNRPIFGFETKKETSLEDKDLGCPVYIYEAGKPHIRTCENLLGYANTRHASSLMETFDRYAPKLLEPIPQNSIIEMDEIGIMEAKSQPFCEAILHCLDGDIPVIAAVKNKEHPFLNSVRSHPNACCFFITAENRDFLTDEIITCLKKPPLR